MSTVCLQRNHMRESAKKLLRTRYVINMTVICLKIDVSLFRPSVYVYFVLNIQFAVLEWVLVNVEVGNDMEMIGPGTLGAILRETAVTLRSFFLRDHGCKDL